MWTKGWMALKGNWKCMQAEETTFFSWSQKKEGLGFDERGIFCARSIWQAHTSFLWPLGMGENNNKKLILRECVIFLSLIRFFNGIPFLLQGPW
jgi:hypothetical protein